MEAKLTNTRLWPLLEFNAVKFLNPLEAVFGDNLGIVFCSFGARRKETSSGYLIQTSHYLEEILTLRVTLSIIAYSPYGVPSESHFLVCVPL